MVQFLLHNSLGAWWESRHPDKACPADLTYLRHAEDGRPAAGTFNGWPDDLSEFRMLDPCCGSGHFLVAALLMLVPMRMVVESLDASAAVDAVMGENLHGLEIDQRCVAIAAFALALEAWRYPGAGGYRALPRINLAWCGQPVGARKKDWISLAEGDSKVETGMGALYDAFRDAPTLGSLIDPSRSVPEDMLTAGFSQLRPLLERALERHSGDAEREETAIAALGMAEAAKMLTGRFHLVATNVPYLARGKQSERLREFSERRYARAKNDLANVMLERCLELTLPGAAAQVVVPQYWFFLPSYRKQRADLLRQADWLMLARLGPGAFKSIGGEVVNVALLTMAPDEPTAPAPFYGLDVGTYPLTEKGNRLASEALVESTQTTQLGHPGHVISLDDIEGQNLLSEYAKAWQGIVTGDDNRFVVCHWEVCVRHERNIGRWNQWERLILPPQATEHWGGRAKLIRWERGEGALHGESSAHNFPPQSVLGQDGVAIQRMSGLSATLYNGEIFGDAVAPVVFNKDIAVPSLAALWCRCSAPGFSRDVRKLNEKTNVTPGTFGGVGLDVAKLERAARARYPNGLPEPYSNDPTQWIFHGHPCGQVIWDERAKRTAHGPLRVDVSVLHVAVVRLLGYRWPAEQDPNMELADQQREWVAQCETLARYADEDGIVCLPSVRGERPAVERLLDLLRESYAESWSEDIPARLLGGRSTTLDDWLCNQFFDEHCKLFSHRPFIWHVSDGRKRDGFHALVSYHRLVEGGGAGRRLLESLAYSYLGDWIARQRDGVARGEAGSDGRLTAALQLRRRLAAIIEGEPPFDLFVRWKPLGEQAIAWNPDVNDGVRLNIRPFLADDIPGGKKGAGILRSKPNVHWRKDRGKEPPRDESNFPWFWVDGRFTGARVNDVHFSNAEKRTARDEARR